MGVCSYAVSYSFTMEKIGTDRERSVGVGQWVSRFDNRANGLAVFGMRSVASSQLQIAPLFEIMGALAIQREFIYPERESNHDSE